MFLVAGSLVHHHEPGHAGDEDQGGDEERWSHDDWPLLT